MFVFKDTVKDELNKTVQKMLDDNELELKYGKGYRIRKRLKRLDLSLVDKIRDSFSHKKCGYRGWNSNKQTVKRLINEIHSLYPHDDLSNLDKAAEAYIKDCNQTGTYIKKLENWLITKDGKGSDAITWLEQIETESVKIQKSKNVI